MKEIKFRALYDGVWYYQTLEEILTTTLAAFRNGSHKTQFTGLFDKMGKEIYEGDYIQYKNKLGTQRTHRVFRAKGGLVINTHGNDFNRETLFYDACADQQTSVYIIQCEVIGNIHENENWL